MITRTKISSKLPVLILLIISLPLILPLFHSGLLATGDGMAHLFRQLNYHQAVLDGQIPPRWAPLVAHGFGAPIFIYNWFLPYSLIEIPILLGTSLVTGVKLFNIFCLLLAPLGMFFWCKKTILLLKTKSSGNILWASFASSVVYAWAPYRLLSVYLYGAWGEMLAMTIVPFLSIAALNLIQTQNRRNQLIYAFLCAALIVSHNISALIYLPLIFIISLSFRLQKTTFVSLLASNIIGIALTSFFWLPALTLSPLIQYNFRLLFFTSVEELGHFPTLIYDLNHTWYQFASPLAKVWYKDFTIGLPLTLSIPFIVLTFLKSKNSRLLLISFFGIAGYFLWLHWAIPLWIATPLKMIIYSYRLLAPATIFLCFAASIALHYLPKKILILTTIILIPASLKAGYHNLIPATGYANVNDRYLALIQPSIHPPGTFLIMGTMEFLPKWTSDTFVRDLDTNLPDQILPKITANSQEFKFQILQNKTDLLQFTYTYLPPASSPTPNYQLIINTPYYPNWHLTVDHRDAPIKPDEIGRISSPLPATPTPHEVLLYWQSSPIEKISNAISLFTLTVICADIIRSYMLNRKSRWSLTTH